MSTLIVGIVIAVVAIFVAVNLLSRFRLNQQYERSAVFRLGKFEGIREAGLYWLWPFVDNAIKVDIRTRTMGFKGQELVSKDGLTLKIDFVMWCKVNDPEKALIQVADWNVAVGQAAETAMRDGVGQNTLSEILNNRAAINGRIKESMDRVTEKWGVEIENVEIKNIDIPETMQRAMAREAEATREASARMIKAEGELKAAQMLKDAATQLTPEMLELRRLQTITEVGAEQNSVIVLAMPMAAMAASGGALASLAGQHLPRPETA